MAFAITQSCCNDASCVTVCPVNCIHPTPDEPDFSSVDMLYIDPAACIDCGACADACPVDAIVGVDELTASLTPYAEINAAYFADRPPQPQRPRPNFHSWGPPVFDRTVPSDLPPLDIAVVGSGPAGMYAVEDLLLHTNARVTLIDRLTEPGGLIRYGVAPDHPSTKRIGETFARFHSHARLRLRLGHEVGADVSVEQLAQRHDAVIYAVGASAARRIGIDGEHLTGSVAATTVVAWYNGHPEVAPDAVDLSTERVVVVGNGNVALDVARILTADPAQLTETTIAPAALQQLRSSKVREIVLLARRGPDVAAYTIPELLALTKAEDVDLVVDAHDESVLAAIDNAAPGSKAALLRDLPRRTIDDTAQPDGTRKRIVLRFATTPEAIRGDTDVRGIAVRSAGGVQEIATGRVIAAVGYRGTAIPGLPFDDSTGTIPHEGGRIVGHDRAYVVGWIKCGPSGGIGANRSCAQETIATLLDDVRSGRLQPRARRGRLSRLLRRAHR